MSFIPETHKISFISISIQGWNICVEILEIYNVIHGFLVDFSWIFDPSFQIGQLDNWEDFQIWFRSWNVWIAFVWDAWSGLQLEFGIWNLELVIRMKNFRSKQYFEVILANWKLNAAFAMPTSSVRRASQTSSLG
jgi:hypothetical protein